MLKETEAGSKNILEALLAAQTRHQQLQAEQEVVSSELETINAEQQARNDEPPPPPPSPVVTDRTTRAATRLPFASSA